MGAKIFEIIFDKAPVAELAIVYFSFDIGGLGLVGDVGGAQRVYKYKQALNKVVRTVEDVQGASKLVRGVKAAEETSVLTGKAAKNAPVIIGENMNRVNAYAGKVGGETIDGWLAGRKWTQQLNDEFISTMKAQGRQFQDIGPDFGRRLQNRIDPSFGRPPSSVYGGERQSLLDYGNYQRLYDRTGKYQGGVPGFDP